MSVILGELVPKNLALSRPEAISAAIIRPLSIIARIFDPLVRLLSGTTNLLVRLFGFSHKDEPEVTEDEVKILIAQGAETGIFENSEKEMVEGVLNLDDRRVTAFMTPRTDVVTLNLEDGIPQLREELLRKADYALLPVIEGDLDRIAGMLNVRKALASIATIPTDAAFDPKAFCQPPVLIPETVSALRAMAILKDKSARTALIVDEYGGVSGLVTMADLLESVLAGLDEDESDAMPGVVQREDGSFLVDGALAIADFAEALELDEAMFDMDAYDTVAGLVLDCMGTIPHAGDHCEWQSLRIEIMDMDGHRVDKVLVNRLSVTDPASLP